MDGLRYQPKTGLQPSTESKQQTIFPLRFKVGNLQFTLHFTRLLMGSKGRWTYLLTFSLMWKNSYDWYLHISLNVMHHMLPYALVITQSKWSWKTPFDEFQGSWILDFKSEFGVLWYRSLLPTFLKMPSLVSRKWGSISGLRN